MNLLRTQNQCLNWWNRKYSQFKLKIFLNSFSANSDIFHLLITFANSLGPDQARQNVWSDLGPECLTLWWCPWHWRNILWHWINILWKLIVKKKSAIMQRVNWGYVITCESLKIEYIQSVLWFLMTFVCCQLVILSCFVSVFLYSITILITHAKKILRLSILWR